MKGTSAISEPLSKDLIHKDEQGKAPQEPGQKQEMLFCYLTK